MKTSEVQEMLLESASSIWVVRHDDGGWCVMCDDRPIPSARRSVMRWRSLDGCLDWLDRRVDFSVEFVSTPGGVSSGRVELHEIV